MNLGFQNKLKFPLGFPAAPGSYGTFFSGEPKERCSNCKFLIKKGKDSYCAEAMIDGNVIAPIKQNSAACKLFKKRKKVKIEKPAYRVTEQDAFNFS